MKEQPPFIFEGFDFTNLAVRLTLLGERSLMQPEKDKLWNVACETVADHARAGRAAADCKRALVTWLWKWVPVLADSSEALARNLNRKFNRFVLAGTVADKRREANKAKRAPKLSQADRDALVNCAVCTHTGDLDAAWTECVAAGKLSREALSRYTVNFSKRVRAPRAIRKQVAREIEAVLPHYVGPRNARLNGAAVQRDWSKTFSGDWYSSDDVTLPVYYYIPDGEGWFTLTRGQFLPMIDVKSKRVLDFVLIDAKTYTAAAIRSLNSRVCSRFGLPRNGWHFERGIWKNAKLLGAGAKCNPWEDFGETFADRLGLRIVHSLPGNARAKVVENVAGLLQDLIEGEPGYVGRNEMVVKYERVQTAKRDVEQHRLHPSEAGFLSTEQWLVRLHQVCEHYNSTPQDSKVMGNRMSPDEAWETCQARNGKGEVIGLTRLPPNLRYLLAAHREMVSVSRRNGVSLFGGKYRYLSGVTGAWPDSHCIAWFDPDQPETLAITDLRGENLQTVPLNLPLDAYNAFIDSPDSARASVAGVNAHNGYGRHRYSELRAKYFPPARTITADVASIEKGRAMHEQRKRVLDGQRPVEPVTLTREQRRAAVLERHREDVELARQLGVPEPPAPIDYDSRETLKDFLTT